MQDKYTEEFDSQMRSMLEDAEVKAPRGVWKGVRSALDSSLGGTPASRWWKWAPALAVAASLAAGIFLIGTKDGSPMPDSAPVAMLDSAPAVSLVAEAALSPESEATPASDIVLESDTRAEAQPAPEASAAPEAGPEGLPLGFLSPSEAQPASGAEPDANQPASGERQAAEERPAPAETPATAAELFAQMAWEDSRSISRDGSRSRLSLQLDGALCGNESQFRTSMDRRAYMSSGTGTATRTGITEDTASSYDIPLSFGLGVRYRFAPRFSVGAGVNYSLLSRSFSGTYTEVDSGVVTRQFTGDVRHKMQYIGIPVNVYFDFVRGKVVDFYGYAGGSAEFCVSNKYSVGEVTLSDPVDRMQFSLGAGVGVQFNVSDFLGIYIDPSARYYFRCDQPKSVRTDKPFMINLEAGLRFNL